MTGILKCVLDKYSVIEHRSKDGVLYYLYEYSQNGSIAELCASSESTKSTKNKLLQFS